MASYRSIQRQMTRFLSRFQRQQSVAFARQSEQPSVGGFGDSADYSQPVVVPGWMRKQYTPEQVLKFVESASAPYHNQFSTPYKQDVPFMPVTEDPLKEWSFQTRVRVLTNCHSAYERNPLGNAGVQYSADYIIGDGFNLACKNSEVSDLLYEFIDNPDNAIREYERQAAIDLQVDGELFLRKFKGKGEDGTGGQIRVIPMRPWECEYIRTATGDFKTRVDYHFEIDGNYGDDPNQTAVTEPLNVPADEMIHVAINRHAYELRGRPDLYRILPWLRAYTDFLEERSRQNRWRNALVWWAKVINATADTVASVSAAFKQPPAPGTILTTSDRIEIAPLSGGSGSGDMEDGRALKNMAITGLRMAEYMFADGAMANLATATAQQLPALTRFAAYQRTLIEQLWYPLFRSIIQSAIDAGLLPEEVEEQDEDGEPITEPVPMDESPKMKTVIPGSSDGTVPGMQAPMPKATPQTPPKKIKTLDAFEITYEPVADTDPKTLADATLALMAEGLMSRKTAQTKNSLDGYYEDKQIKREQQQDQRDMAAGLKPIPPEMMRPEAMPAGKPGQPGANGKQPVPPQ